MLPRPAQVDVFLEEADQLDTAANAWVKGSRSQPHQPQLVQTRRVLEAARQTVVLLEQSHVSAFGGARGQCEGQGHGMVRCASCRLAVSAGCSHAGS
jgi:hypothetical protein